MDVDIDFDEDFEGTQIELEEHDEFNKFIRKSPQRQSMLTYFVPLDPYPVMDSDLLNTVKRFPCCHLYLAIEFGYFRLPPY